MADRLISADKLKQHYAWWGSVDKETSDTMTYPEAKSIVDTIVDMQPTIEAEPTKHGRWIKERVHNLHNGEKRNARECSECGAIYFVYDMANAIDEVPRYCPNCGALMDLDEVEE